MAIAVKSFPHLIPIPNDYSPTVRGEPRSLRMPLFPIRYVKFSIMTHEFPSNVVPMVSRLRDLAESRPTAR